jgi:hypothetical protein
MFLIDVFRFFENLSRYLASAKEYAMPKRYCAFGGCLASSRRGEPIHPCECRVEPVVLNALTGDVAAEPRFNIE